MHLIRLLEGALRQGFCRRRIEMQIDHIQIVRFQQSFERIFMRDQAGSRGANVNVVIRMIPVPVRIDG